MKFSGKMCLMIILKVTKNQGFILSLEDTFFEKPQGGEVKLTPPPSRFTADLSYNIPKQLHGINASIRIQLSNGASKTKITFLA